MDPASSSQNNEGTTRGAESGSSMLDSFLYDTSSIQDRFVQSRPEPSADRIRRLMTMVSVTAVKAQPGRDNRQ
ncbi:hypothetical protein B0T18DRAFT_429886 [Schizothecium vesticola]|uniref:Uncharacterized protein n=1 Tax=Schizothecium vesticola TaxID=314040 RepID=A0AA40EWV2_9PEZI|nr:hypothetical protein B0T18DRAFT_429886 [Schizothecium vesticola]